MTLNANAVRVAGTGEVYVATAETAAPDVTATPSVSWTGLGYTSPDGVTFTLSRDTTDIDGWQASRLRVVTNSEPKTLGFTLLQTDKNTLPVVFGGGSITQNGYIATYTPPAEGTNTVRAILVRFTDGAYTYQYWFSRAQIDGDVTFNLTRSDAVGYALSFAVLADDPTTWDFSSNDPYMS